MVIESPVKLAHFRAVYVEDAPERADTFCHLFDQLLDLTVVTNATDAIRLLKQSDPVDLVIINETAGGGQLLNVLNFIRIEQGFSTILLNPNAVPDLNIQDKGQPTIDVFPLDLTALNLQRRISYLVRKKNYLARQFAPEVFSQVRMPLGKRIFDVLLSSLMLLFLMPLLVVTAALIRLDSKGPIFYKSRRTGMGYRLFYMYKFRTMRIGADKLILGMTSQNMYNDTSKATPVATEELCELCRLTTQYCQQPLFEDGKQICETTHQQKQRSQATFMKFKADPRVTRLGKFLRNASIDELPQLLNILRGDMSFVGNRPLPPYEAERLTAAEGAQRFLAPAGLTGLWQVMKRGRAGVSDQERIELDARYADTYSFRMDLYILIRTAWAVFQKENV